jgi:predicted naringenin-chalcone synthase
MHMTEVLELPWASLGADSGAVALLGMGTAVPGAVTQGDARDLACRICCSSETQAAWLDRVFFRAGVESRGSVLAGSGGIADIHRFYPTPKDPSDRGPTTAVRMQRYAQEAPPLATRAARAALADARVAPEEITHLITVSCTGFFAPGLDAALIDRLGLPTTIHRRLLGFMGCHGGFNALGAARDILLAHEDAHVLVCCVELCTLHFAYGWEPERLVANALFGDGASACVLGAGGEAATGDAPAVRAGGHWRLRQTASLRLPSSGEAMTWRIGDHGFEMTLSAELPALIGSHVRAWCESWLATEGLTLGDIAHWAIHPGGPKILAAAAEALHLPLPANRASRAVLARHGNMSSATLLFILQEITGQQKAPANGDYCVALGFGPGLMAEGLLLQFSNN